MQRQIKFSGSVGEFFDLLVPTLIQYGELDDRRNALEAVLETAKDYLGRDRRVYCDYLIQQLRPLPKKMKEFHLVPGNLGVQLVFPGDPQNFDDAKRQILIDLIAELLNIEKSSVQISYVIPAGSFYVIITLPVDAALELVTLFKTESKQAVQFLHQTSVKHIDIIEGESIEQLVSLKTDSSSQKSPNVFRDKIASPLVFILAEPIDVELSNKISSVLKKSGVSYHIFRSQNGKPSEIRNDFEHNVLNCDALIIVYGRVSVKWVEYELSAIQKILIHKERSLPLAVYDGPPKQKPPVSFKVPGMHILECRSALDERQIGAFTKALQIGRIT